jgi:hypothetical protein
MCYAKLGKNKLDMSQEVVVDEEVEVDEEVVVVVVVEVMSL